MPHGHPGYRELFEERGAGYDDAMDRWPNARDEEFGFAVALASLQPGDRLLDLPAGGGYLAAHLPDGVEHLAVETATSFADRCRTRGIEVVESDLCGRGLPSGGADVIVSVAGTHHHEDRTELLSQWRRLVAPGGRLVLADVAAGSREATFLDGFVGEHNTVGHRGTFLGDDLATVALASGWADPRIVDGAYHWWFEDEAGLGRFCTGLFGLVGPSEAEVVEAVRRGPGIDTEASGRVGVRWGLRALVATRPA